MHTRALRASVNTWRPSPLDDRWSAGWTRPVLLWGFLLHAGTPTPNRARPPSQTGPGTNPPLVTAVNEGVAQRPRSGRIPTFHGC